MASFTVTCNQCGEEQKFSDKDPKYKEKNSPFLNERYFENGEVISISANPFSDPPEITIECKNPDCKSEI